MNGTRGLAGGADDLRPRLIRRPRRWQRPPLVTRRDHLTQRPQPRAGPARSTAPRAAPSPSPGRHRGRDRRPCRAPTPAAFDRSA